MSGASVDAALYQVPFMANAVITVPTRTPLTPYGGFGLGGTSSIIDADHITAGGSLSSAAKDYDFHVAGLCGD